LTPCAGPVFVTLSGLYLGTAPTASIPNGINIATSVDTASATGAASGVIGGQVRDVKFSMDATDRVAGRKCTSTFSFVSASPVPAGGSISLVYPSGFFSLSCPLETSRVSVLLDNSSPGASTTARISFTPTNVGNFNVFIVTLTGFKSVPGQLNLVSSFGGIDDSPAASAALTSDGVLKVSFAAGKLIAGRVASFSVSNIQNPSSAESSLNINIRAATYGISSPSLQAFVGSSGGIRPIFIENKNTLVLNEIPNFIPAGAVDVRLVDITMGAPMPSTIGINVATSQDYASFSAASSGPIFGKIRNLQFIIQSGARVAFSANAVAVYSFSTDSAVPIGGSLQFCHPVGFFQPDSGPLHLSFGNCSSCIQWISSSCMLATLATLSMPAGPQIVSISGLVLGRATSGGSVFVRSSVDYASDPVHSGSVGGRIRLLRFVMSNAERVPRTRNVSATISFVTASAVEAAFTLNFPENFFDTSSQPSVVSSFQLTQTQVLFSSSSSIIFTANSAVPAGPIAITLVGLATGPPTSGGPISITSPTDVSMTVVSGALGAVVTGVQGISVTSATADMLVVQFDTSCQPQSCFSAAPVFSLKWQSPQASINLQESCSPSALSNILPNSMATFNATCPMPGYSASTHITLVLVKDSLGISQDLTAGPFNVTIAPFSTSDPGSAPNCFVCPAGTIASDACPSSLASCRACPIGSYSSRAGSDVCWRCPLGSFSDKRGATVCNLCGPGLFSSAVGAAACTVCPAGTRSQFNFGSTMCLQCVSGTFSPEKSSSCIVCGVGYYSSTPGSTSCFPCMSNTFSVVAGAVSPSQCQSCPAGTMSTAAAGFCTDCQPGTFRPYQSATGCTCCPPNLFSPAKAALCTTCKLDGYGITKNGQGLTCAPPLFISSAIIRSRNVTLAVSLASVDPPTGPISGVLISNLPVSSSGSLQASCSGIVSLATTALYNADSGQFTISWSQPALLTANFYVRCQVIGLEISAVPSSRAVSASLTSATRKIMDFPLGVVNVFQSSLTSASLMSSSNISAAATTLTVLFKPSNASLSIKSLKLGNTSFSYAVNSNPEGFLCRQQVNASAPWLAFASTVSIAIDSRVEFQASFQFSPALRASVSFALIRCEFPGIINGNAAPAHSFATIATFQDAGADIVLPLDVAYNVPFPAISDPQQLMVTSIGDLSPVCQPGSYWYFSSADFSTSCQPCPQGTFSIDKDSTSCTPCSAGFFSSVNRSSSSQACQLCPAGSFCVLGSILPTACPLGQYSLAGSITCTVCQKGFFSPALGAASPSSCQACPLGSYASSTGLSSCSRCSYGEFSDKVASTMCETCPVGLYTRSEGSSSFSDCMPCPAGTFWSQGNCAPCAPGTYNPTVGSMDSSSCMQCPPGFISGFGSNACKACSAGSIAPTAGSASCIFCPLGAYSLSANSQCTPCPANTFSVNSPALGISTCSPCATDSFSSDGSSSCSALVCSPGTVRVKLGSSPAVCSLCPAGSYSPSSNSRSCITCSAGSFAPLAGSSMCQTCIPGTFSVDGSLACSACPQGFVSAVNSSTCTLCPAGTYEINKSCLACPPNFFSDAGSSSCTWCGAGSISTLGSAICIKCNAGSYWRSESLSLPTQSSPSLVFAPTRNTGSGAWGTGSLASGRNGLASTSLPSQNVAFFAGGNSSDGITNYLSN
jgi:hypothetical protein